MTWNALDFDWNHVRAFLVTVEQGSLSAAARALRQTQPTVGRQVAALEAELGVALFDRIGNALELTQAGTELIEQVRLMGQAAERVSLTASGQAQTIEGMIRISVSELYAGLIMPAIAAGLRQRHPDLKVDILVTNSLSDLRRREADIAIRNAEPQDPDLIGRKLGQDGATLFATPDYLASLGSLNGPEDFADAQFLSLGDNTEISRALSSVGFRLTDRNFMLSTGESHMVHWHFTRAGLGIGFGPIAVGMADPLLVPVLPDPPIYPFPIWLCAAKELRTSARVRAVFDYLTEALPPLFKNSITGA
ncbi:LysR family transcriptional regulator [Jannaschia sp. M317]|uniref:LysR family transcriptional regulator n=1 Tax=Jannaschia sp. M317 TaxID=2867011 RepID=UPI0021A63F48|nr:LysR family transcriptional regulator [Jannaschia sp. M317]UWQ16207.1 LysR family transcriptional regulator [Jannaschia sp. M317]